MGEYKIYLHNAPFLGRPLRLLSLVRPRGSPDLNAGTFQPREQVRPIVEPLGPEANDADPGSNEIVTGLNVGNEADQAQAAVVTRQALKVGNGAHAEKHALLESGFLNRSDDFAVIEKRCRFHIQK